MITEKFLVPGVSCQHCVNAVNKEVGALSGVQKVEVNLDTKVVTVEHGDQVVPAAIIAAIQEAGYEEVSAVA
jgi:copper ion binding protein